MPEPVAMQKCGLGCKHWDAIDALTAENAKLRERSQQMRKRAFVEWKTAHSPRWYLRIGCVAFMWWPNEPWYRKLEVVRR